MTWSKLNHLPKTPTSKTCHTGVWNISILSWEYVCSVARLCSTARDLMDCSPPGSSVDGILQARVLEWVAIPSPGDLPDPEIEPTSLVSPALVGRF